MRRKGSLIATLFILSLGVLVSGASAQTTAQERLDALKAQLEELQIKQVELQQRLATLDEQLKPDNIEKSLAGVGSTHPEELREQRRKQLEIEKSGIQKQLDLLASNRIRLENVIAQANADAYHQSANGSAVTQSLPVSVSPQLRKRSGKTKARPRRPQH